MRHFIKKNKIFPILFFLTGFIYSGILANLVNENFLSCVVIFSSGVFVSFAFAALIWFYQLLFKKKEELHKAKDVITSANTTLLKKNAELEEYVYAVSHDLQEPLNTINGFIEVLEEDYPTLFKDAEVNQYFALISSTSSRMRVMVRELLTYAKLGTKRQTESVNIGNIVEETLLDLTHLIKKSGTVINLPNKFPTIKGHPLELKLLFQNLLINAIKYQKPDIKPIVNIYFEGSHLENKFTIQDNGIGIDKKHQDSIFKLFHRLHKSNKYSGSGIGLTKCKKIIDLHNGTIWVESIPKNGSSFHFIIPSAQIRNAPKIQ